MPKIVATEERWIEIGMRRFAEGGSKALVVERLAAALGCSKSSFYWYFTDREAYLQRILAAWRDRTTNRIISEIGADAAEEQPLRSLLLRMFAATRHGDFLFHLRRLAAEEAAFGAMLDEVERMRTEYVQQLLERQGFPADRAHALSWMLYHYYLGWYERHKYVELTAEEVERHVSAIWREWFDYREGGGEK